METALLSLGNAIRARREQGGESQEAFADRIGMHRAYYSAIERGRKNLTLTTLMRVLDGLGCTLAQVSKEARV